MDHGFVLPGQIEKNEDRKYFPDGVKTIYNYKFNLGSAKMASFEEIIGSFCQEFDAHNIFTMA